MIRDPYGGQTINPAAQNPGNIGSRDVANGKTPGQIQVLLPVILGLNYLGNLYYRFRGKL